MAFCFGVGGKQSGFVNSPPPPFDKIKLLIEMKVPALTLCRLCYDTHVYSSRHSNSSTLLCGINKKLFLFFSFLIAHSSVSIFLFPPTTGNHIFLYSICTNLNLLRLVINSSCAYELFMRKLFLSFPFFAMKISQKSKGKHLKLSVSLSLLRTYHNLGNPKAVTREDGLEKEEKILLISQALWSWTL